MAKQIIMSGYKLIIQDRNLVLQAQIVYKIYD